MTRKDTDLADLQKALGFTFRDKGLLREALVHSSYLNENPDCGLSANERLEFLGDAILGFVIAQWLFQRHPSLPEGRLTELRSAIVRREPLARAGERLRLGDHLLLGRGEDASGGRQRPTNLAGAFEAVLGAVLVDGGVRSARGFVLRHLRLELRAAAAGAVATDAKSLLQQAAQSRWHTTPSYTVLQAEGPDHAKVFTVQVEVAGRKLATGVGPSKRAAERQAARQALNTLAEDRNNVATS